MDALSTVKYAGLVAAVVAAVHVALPLLLRRPVISEAVLRAVGLVAQTVVRAIEQQSASSSGIDKKQLAVQTVQELLSTLHVQAPAALINAAIEAAVLAMNRLMAPKTAP